MPKRKRPDEEKESKLPSSPTPAKVGPVVDPDENDVLSGRGDNINRHPGNQNFRKLVEKKRNIYSTSRFKSEKRMIAASIVSAIRELDPPGRFLSKDPKSGLWDEIGDERAREKTSQALREKVKSGADKDSGQTDDKKGAVRNGPGKKSLHKEQPFSGPTAWMSPWSYPRYANDYGQPPVHHHMPPTHAAQPYPPYHPPFPAYHYPYPSVGPPLPVPMLASARQSQPPVEHTSSVRDKVESPRPYDHRGRTSSKTNQYFSPKKSPTGGGLKDKLRGKTSVHPIC